MESKIKLKFFFEVKEVYRYDYLNELFIENWEEPPISFFQPDMDRVYTANMTPLSSQLTLIASRFKDFSGRGK